MALSGSKSRAIALLLPLLFAAACTSQNSMDGDMGLQPRASYAASTPATLSASTETQSTSSGYASPDADKQVAEQIAGVASDGPSTIAPAYADANEAKSRSGKKLVQVASLYPSAPALGQEAGTAETGVKTFSEELAAPRTGKAYRFSSRDHECLARAMFFESNRSSRDGLVAVGSVVMNRVESGKWGNSVCGVVGAPRQFAPGVLSRNMNSAALPDVMEAAASVLKGERHPKVYKEVMYFHTAGYRFGYDNMHYVTVAGGNSFYEKRRRMRDRPNTPQSVVMANPNGSRFERLAAPVKTAFAAPVKAATSLFSHEEQPKPVKRKQRKSEPAVIEAQAAPSELPGVVEAPRPTQKPSLAPAEGYLKAPSATSSGEFVNVAGTKGGRVTRKPQSETR